jgi:hypothetical protein
MRDESNLTRPRLMNFGDALSHHHGGYRDRRRQSQPCRSKHVKGLDDDAVIALARVCWHGDPPVRKGNFAGNQSARPTRLHHVRPLPAQLGD